jgi:hypothetical protein
MDSQLPKIVVTFVVFVPGSVYQTVSYVVDMQINEESLHQLEVGIGCIRVVKVNVDPNTIGNGIGADGAFRDPFL